MDVVITLHRIDALTDDEHAALRVLSQAVYPPDEVTDWPGRHLQWAAAEWCVRVWDGDGTLVSYTGIVLRQAMHDGKPVRIGGIGGVKTHPAARRRGYARSGLQRAHEFFHAQQNVDFALLVCAPHLLPYYSGLGWQEFGGRLLVEQHGAMAEFTFNRVMTCDIQAAGPVAGTIDLCGPPW